MPPTPQFCYSGDLKKQIIYQKTVLSMLPTEIAIILDMPLHVMQQVLQSWDEVRAEVRETKKLGWACLMTTDQVSVSKTKLSRGLC